MAATLLPDGRSAPIHFHSVDALALHILRQRPGRPIDLLPSQISRDGRPEFPGLALFTLRPSTRRERDGSLTPVMQDEWLGWAVDDAADETVLRAALDRMTAIGARAA